MSKKETAKNVMFKYKIFYYNVLNYNKISHSNDVIN